MEKRTVRRSILYSLLLFFGCTIAYYREPIRHSNEYCRKHQWVRLIQQVHFDFCQSDSVVVLHCLI